MHVLELKERQTKAALELDFEPNETTALELKHKVDGLAVVDKPSFDAAEALRATIKEARKIETKPVAEEKDNRHAAWKKLVAIEKNIKDRYEAILAPLTGKLNVYAEEQNRIAEEEAKRQAAEAQKRADDEMKRREDEHIANAARLEAEGQTEAAEAAIESSVPEPVVAPPEPVIPLVKVAGSRKVWKYEITDMRAFVQGCLDGTSELSIRCVAEDAGELGHRIRHGKDKFSAPGIKVWVENSR